MLILAARDFTWLVGSLCRLHRIPFDEALLAQQFPPPHSRASLTQAARALGLEMKARSLQAALKEASRRTCIAFLRNSGAEPAPSAPRPALVLGADQLQVLYFDPSTEAPRTARRDEIDRIFEPHAFSAHKVEPLIPEDGAVPKAQAHLGFGWFVAELSKHKRTWCDVVVASLVIQLIGLATPIGTQLIIDKVIVHQTQSTLIVIASALALFLTFNALMSWGRQYLIIHTGNRIDAVLAARVFRHLFALPIAFFERRPTGTLTARLQGVESIREFLSGAAVTLILDLPFAAIFLALMFWYSWELSSIAVGILLAIATLSILVTPIFRQRLDRQFLAAAQKQAFLTEYIAAAETVKSLQMEPQLETRFGAIQHGYLRATFGTRALVNTYGVGAQALEQAMTLGILIVGALLVMRNDGFTIGMLVAFQMFANRLSQPVMRLVGLWQEFQQASIAARRLADIVQVPPEPYAVMPSRSPDAAGRIDLREVSFRYDQTRPYLYRNFSLSVRPGAMIAIMGPSGSGKSTLAKLLLGFYPATEGEIAVDGRDVRHLAANELRQTFGVVPQEPRLFSGTILENLAIANPYASFEDMVVACKMAELHEVIEALPLGYRTVLGEHGVGLSGGQKQRLAIARALLKRARVVLFDEATSSLDPATAEAFARTVNRIKGKATILFIAHHLPRGLDVDSIVRLGMPTPVAATAGTSSAAMAAAGS